MSIPNFNPNGYPMNLFSYPVNFQPQQQMMQMQQPQPQVQQQQQAQQSSPYMTWVQGIEGAKAYHVAPDTTIPLWDSEAMTVYIKSADKGGMPSMRIIDYTIRDDNPQPPAIVTKEESEPVDYVTHKELSLLEARLKKQIGKMSKDKDKEAEDDE